MSETMKPLSAEFRMARLEVCDLFQLMVLHNKVLAALPGDKKNFLAKKSVAEMHEALSEVHYAVGIFDQPTNVLVGAAFLLKKPPQTLTSDLTEISTFIELPDNVETSHVITTVMSCVKNEGLMAHMLRALNQVAVDRNCSSLFARVNFNNEHCQKLFEDAGFKLTQMGTKPSDEHHASRIIYCKRLPVEGQEPPRPHDPVYAGISLQVDAI